MRYLTYIVIVALQVAVIFPAFGQNVKKANKKIASYEYAKAIPPLEKIVEKNRKDKEEAILLLAHCYRMINNDVEAAKYYGMAIQQKDLSPEVYYNYGQTLRTLEHYEKAKEQFLEYARLAPEDERGQLLAGYCEKMKEWSGLPVKHEVHNVVSLNSPFAD